MGNRITCSKCTHIQVVMSHSILSAEVLHDSSIPQFGLEWIFNDKISVVLYLVLRG